MEQGLDHGLLGEWHELTYGHPGYRCGGAGLYVIHRWLPLPAEIKNLLNVVVILILVVWLLKAFGIIKWLSEVGL